MAELTPADLVTYTSNRLSISDPNVAIVLAAALQQVRSYCKWSVSPVLVNDQFTFDGPGQWGGYSVGTGSLYGTSYTGSAGVLKRTRVGGSVLYLPTKRLQGIASIVEDGVTLDLSTIQWSTRGEVVKADGSQWSTNLHSITVTFTHGWTEAEAADWRRIVLAVADRMSLTRGLVGAFPVDVGPYRVGGYFGSSRPGNLPVGAGWLDDLFGMIDSKRYVIQEV